MLERRGHSGPWQSACTAAGVKRLALVLLAAWVAFGADNKPVITGHWVLNVQRSSFGRMAKPNGMTLDARYEGGVFRSTQVVDRQEGQDTTSGEWITDGKEHALPEIRGTQKTYWQGQTLVNVRRAADGSFDQTIRLSVSNDGHTATETIALRDKNGSSTAKLVWEKR